MNKIATIKGNSLVLNGYTAVIALGLYLLVYKSLWDIQTPKNGVSIVTLLVLGAGVIVLHEGIHAGVALLFVGRRRISFGMTWFVIVCRVHGFMTRTQYVLYALAPAALLGLCGVILYYVLTDETARFLSALLFVGGISSGGGDFWFAVRALRFPSKTIMLDNGMEMEVFLNEPSEVGTREVTDVQVPRTASSTDLQSSMSEIDKMTVSCERYLGLLGVRRESPGIEALTRLVRAHAMRIPFENVSKLYYLRTNGRTQIPDLDEYLDGIERYHFGGTCYSNNFQLYQLLRFLGYDAALCGADMSKPDVHIVTIVSVEAREYIVDAGYAAPFLEPLPRDSVSDYIVSLGADRYVLSPKDPMGRSRLTLYRDGVARHGYVVNPAPRGIEEFQDVIADSFRSDATFMNALLLVKLGVDCSTILHNMTQIESRGSTVKKRVFASTGDLITAIQEHFGIPASITRIALDGVTLRQDAWN